MILVRIWQALMAISIGTLAFFLDTDKYYWVAVVSNRVAITLFFIGVIYTARLHEGENMGFFQICYTIFWSSLYMSYLGMLLGGCKKRIIANSGYAMFRIGKILAISTCIVFFVWTVISLV